MLELIGRIRHHIKKEGTMWVGVDHFFAMFPATVLMPLLINEGIGYEVFDVSLALFTSGVGTLVFLLWTRGRVSAYLGSSFTFIGFSIYLITDMNGAAGGDAAFAYIFWAYIFAGAQLFLLSFLYKIDNFEKFRERYLPDAVLGPAISLIGLGIVDRAASNAGFGYEVNTTYAVIAVVTFGTVVLLSVVKRKFMKHTYIFVSIILATAFAAVFSDEFRNFEILGICNGEAARAYSLGSFNWPLSVSSIPILQFSPSPLTLLMLFFSVIPATLLIFTENYSRVIIIKNLKMKDVIKDADNDSARNTSKDFGNHGVSTRGQGISILIASFLGSVPNTLYAENIAVMSIGNNDTRKQEKLPCDDHPAISQIKKTTSWVPYVIAALLAILASFSVFLYNVLNEGIPTPVIGGIGLFLFGLIAAPGIQLLVQGRVDYRKISNQILTASVLIAGISTIRLPIPGLPLSGMGLGLVIGMALNAIFIILKNLNILNEAINFGELLNMCVGGRKPLNISNVGMLKESAKLPPNIGDFEKVLIPGIPAAEYLMQSKIVKSSDEGLDRYEAERLIETIHNSNYAAISDDINNSPVMMLRRTDSNNLYLYVSEKRLSPKIINMYKSDFHEFVETESEYIRVGINREISIKRIEKIVNSVWDNLS